MHVIWLSSSYTKHLNEKEDKVPSPDENLRLPVVDLLVALMSELKFKEKSNYFTMRDKSGAFRRAVKS